MGSTTLGAVVKRLAQDLLQGRCTHPTHPIWAQFTIAPECIELSIAEVIVRAVQGERERLATKVRQGCPPAGEHVPQACSTCALAMEVLSGQ